jgi:hypothetical protein
MTMKEALTDEKIPAVVGAAATGRIGMKDKSK